MPPGRLSEQLAGDLPGQIAAEHLLAPLVGHDVADEGHAERNDPAGGERRADARERERGERLREPAGEHGQTAQSAQATAIETKFAEAVADRADDQLHRAVRDRVGRDDDRGGADGHADIGGDLRQQRIRHAHHRLAGKARKREQHDRAGRGLSGRGIGGQGPGSLMRAAFPTCTAPFHPPRPEILRREMPGIAPPGAISCQRGRNPYSARMTIEKTYQPARRRRAHLPDVGSRAGVSRRPAGAARRRALHHRHSAAERHRLAAHGPRAQQHAAGHPVPLRAHARARRAVAAGHRPRRHRDPDGGRAADDGAAGAGPARHRAREVPREGLGLEGRVRRHHHQPAQAARRVVRLVARALHHGRGAVARPCSRSSSSSTGRA